jgi:metal-responsive CopG/Arc/MetJ family transcriptional regulator
VTATTRRISLELPTTVVERLEAQAEMTGVGRGYLIEAAVGALLAKFEQIDAEEGCPCTCGSPRAHASFCRYRPKP